MMDRQYGQLEGASQSNGSTTLYEESNTGVTLWQMPSRTDIVKEYDFYGVKPVELSSDSEIGSSSKKAKHKSDPIKYNGAALDAFAEKGRSSSQSPPPVEQNSKTVSPDRTDVSSLDYSKRSTVSSVNTERSVYYLDNTKGRTAWVAVPQSTKKPKCPTNVEQEPPVEEEKAPPPPSSAIDVQGWRRVLLVGSVLMGLFLGFLDTTIVSVALPSIAGDFNNFSDSTWIVTSYLLSYMAFAIIISRFSDIFGRQAIEIGSFLIFLGFSLGCALSPNMITLIICRAFQGIGGSGLYSMCMVIAFNAVPPAKGGVVAGLIGIMLTIGGIAGPLLSGAICNSTTWRWIFYLNLPTGGFALLAFVLAWPRDRGAKRLTRSAFASIDILGSILLLAGSILVVFAMQQAGTYVLAWNSAVIAVCLTLVPVCFLAFIAWQLWLASHPDFPVKPTFPVKIIVTERVIGASVL